ncbi:MAG: chemotaxis-specific protein-glutamate methyltransferase CheB [Desulfoplanes sp.]
MEKIKSVLVVDDSRVARTLLVAMLESDPLLHVIGTAENGLEALRFLEKNPPDIVVMDINMPVMDGLEATRQIMQNQAMPVVIVSAEWEDREHVAMFQALETGALAFVAKPQGPRSAGYVRETHQFIDTVRLMSEVKVVSRPAHFTKTLPVSRKKHACLPGVLRPSLQAVAIGVSAGGPLLLQHILEQLPPLATFPLFIAQHITPGFSEAFVHWLSRTSVWPVRLAEYGARITNGTVYIAKGGTNMEVNTDHKIVISKPASPTAPTPCVDILFDSVLHVYGSACAGILLTGMGRDGAQSLLNMRRGGAVTIAQDKASSAVYGMPGEAVKLGAARYILTPDQIMEMLQGRPRV